MLLFNANQNDPHGIVCQKGHVEGTTICVNPANFQHFDTTSGPFDSVSFDHFWLPHIINTPMDFPILIHPRTHHMVRTIKEEEAAVRPPQQLDLVDIPCTPNNLEIIGQSTHSTTISFLIYSFKCHPPPPLKLYHTLCL